MPVPPVIAWFLTRQAFRRAYSSSYNRVIEHYKSRYLPRYLPPIGVSVKSKKMPAPPEYRPRVGKRRRGGQMIMPDGGSYANSSYKRPKVRKIQRNVVNYQRAVTGRWKSWSAKMLSVLKGQTFTLIDRFQNLTSIYDGTGAVGLNHVSSATYAGLPVALFELNALPYASEGGTKRFSYPLTKLYIQGANYNFASDGVFAKDNENVATTFAWTVEQQPFTSDVSIFDRAYLDWIDIRLMLNGPRKAHSRLHVQLVRFPDDDCQPPAYKATDGTGAGVTTTYPVPSAGESLAEWNGMWSELTAPLIGNPLAVRATQNTKRIQVLKDWTFDFQPRDTSEDGPVGGVGDQVAFKIRHGVGKSFRYTKLPTLTNPDQDDFESDAIVGDWNRVQANTDVVVHARPKARLFLMIKAFTPSRVDAGADTVAANNSKQDNDVGCSFDFCIRRKWMFGTQ